MLGWLALAGCLAVPASASPLRFGPCTASVYWEGFGRPLADGHRHTPGDVLAAHRTLPLGTLVRVTLVDRETNKPSVDGRRPDRDRPTLIVPIFDRGPFVRSRCIDLSRGAAAKLGMSGLAPVLIEVLRPGDRH